MSFAHEAVGVCIFDEPDRRILTRPSPMLFKLLQKLSQTPRIEEGSTLSDNLARRLSAIEFKPSRGFLKDQQQPKRATVPYRDLHKSTRPDPTAADHPK
jgi:hypothetical protein